MPDVRPLEPNDADWVERVLRAETAGPRIASRGRLHDGLALPGVVAIHDGDRAGVLLYEIVGGELEVVFIAATVREVGVGATLLEAAADVARGAGCRRAWLVTTNDNTPALRFYQRCGWDLVAVHRGAVTAARDLKPEIPARGHDGIAIRHEVEVERPI